LIAVQTKIGIVTVSDRASRGEYEDRGGPAVEDYLNEVIVSEFSVVAKVIPDDVELIQQTLIELCDNSGCCLVVTTGGTGPAVRDVTPEATEIVCDKMMPGFGEQMRTVSLTKVPTAILSRQTAGIRSAKVSSAELPASSSDLSSPKAENESDRCGSLIINLPGSPKAIAECLDAVFAAVPYCVDLIDGPMIETNPERIVAFRPKKK
jgi:molybdopterin adenylyltransferase